MVVYVEFALKGGRYRGLRGRFGAVWSDFWPGKDFHYQDGDTQPFTMCFAVKTWAREAEQTDKEEITENG